MLSLPLNMPCSYGVVHKNPVQMKAKFGAIVVDGRGKIGGHVMSKNRGGAYMRTKVTPVNPNTSAQQTARNLVGNLSQAWRTLTDEQRASWNAAVQDFAKTDIFGDVRNPTGFNLYVKLNANLDNIGEAALSVAPSATEVANVIPSAIVLNNTGSVGTIAFAPTVPAGMTVIVRATPSLSSGINFVKSEFRIITTMPATTTTGFDFWAAYVAKFGAPITGQKVFVSLETVVIASGQKSVPSQVSTIVLNA